MPHKAGGLKWGKRRNAWNLLVGIIIRQDTQEQGLRAGCYGGHATLWGGLGSGGGVDEAAICRGVRDTVWACTGQVTGAQAAAVETAIVGRQLLAFSLGKLSKIAEGVEREENKPEGPN